MKFELQPSRSFTNDVVILDGMWGTGKSILSSLIGSLEGVEKKRIDYTFEYICNAHSLGRVSDDFAQSLIRINADLNQYDNLIGREVNLRLKDDSGFRNTPGSTKYLRRLFGPEGDQVVDVINARNLALLLVSHHIIITSEPLYKALGSRLFLIEVVRHPLQLVNYWTRYLEDFERSREFTLGTLLNGKRVPWFAFDWASDYVRMPALDRAIRSIHQIQLQTRQSVSELNEPTRRDVRPPLVVSFESLVTETTNTLERVSNYLGRKPSRSTARAMRKQDVPRSLSSAGRRSNSRSWLPNSKLHYQTQLEQIRESIGRAASHESQRMMGECITDYERRFPLNTIGHAASAT